MPFHVLFKWYLKMRLMSWLNPSEVYAVYVGGSDMSRLSVAEFQGGRLVKNRGIIPGTIPQNWTEGQT